MKSSVIINILVIIIGILTLYADYVIAYHMDLGNPVTSFTTTFSTQNIVQKPLALFISAIVSIALLGGFLIVYPILCIKNRISCIGFR